MNLYQIKYWVKYAKPCILAFRDGWNRSAPSNAQVLGRPQEKNFTWAPLWVSPAVNADFLHLAITTTTPNKSLGHRLAETIKLWRSAFDTLSNGFSLAAETQTVWSGALFTCSLWLGSVRHPTVLNFSVVLRCNTRNHAPPQKPCGQ